VSKVQREHHKRKYLRLSEVAEILGVHYTTVYYAAKKGKIPSRRINSLWLVPYEYVEEVKNGKEDNK